MMVNRGGEETLLESYVREYQNDPEYVAGELATDVTDEVLELLADRGLTQTWLADRMGMSRQRVSRIFSATPNLTLLSIARLSIALNVTPKVLLNSGGYYIHPITASTDPGEILEDIATAKMFYQTQNEFVGTSTVDTTNSVVGRGVRSDAFA